MAFGNELKEFVAGFQSGWKMVSDDRRVSADQDYRERKLKSDEGYRERKFKADEAYRSEAGARAQQGLDIQGRRLDLHEEEKLGYDRSVGGALERTPAPEVPGLGKLSAADRAISGIESGGNYRAVGPVTDSGDRAYGKHQVMGRNIPVWTKEVLGRSLTPSQFLADERAQDAVFRTKFAQAVREHGSYQDAASVWFTGKPLSQGAGRRDVLGTTGAGYVRKFNRRFAGGVPLDDEEEPIIFAATGGLIEDPEEASVDTSSDEAIVQTASAEDPYEGYDAKSMVDRAGAAEAVDGGMKFAQKQFGFDRPGVAQADPRYATGLKAYASGAGAASREEIEGVKNAVDPKKQLSEELRMIAAYNSVHKYWTQKGRPDRANRAAASMLMYSKMAAATAGTAAQAALEKGDTKTAAALMGKAYEAVPDGKSFKVTKADKGGVDYEIDDIDDGLTDKGRLSINHMIEIATGMRNGTEWLSAVGAIKTAPRDKVAVREERSRKALEAYHAADDGGGATGAFLESMSAAQRKAFDALPATEQNAEKNRFLRNYAEEAKAGRFQTRREDQLGRFNTLMEERRTRAARPVARGGSTAAERADLSVEQRAAEREREVLTEPGPPEEAAGLMTRAGPSEEQRNRVMGIRAGRAWEQSANDRKASASGREQFDADYKTINEGVNAYLDDPKRKAEGFDKLPERQRRAYADIASDIREANQVVPQVATDIMFEALDPNVRLVENNGLVVVGSNKPVRMSEDTVLKLIALRQKNGSKLAAQRGKNVDPALGVPRTATAIPGASGGRTPEERQRLQRALDEERAMRDPRARYGVPVR